MVILNKAREVCWLTLPNKVDKPSVTCCLGVPFVLSQCKQFCTEGSKGPTSSHRVEWNKSKIAFWRRVLSIFKDLQSIYQHGVFFFWTSCLSRLSSTLLHDFLHRFLLYEFCTLKYSCTREGFVNTRRIYALVVVYLFFSLATPLSRRSRSRGWCTQLRSGKIEAGRSSPVVTQMRGFGTLMESCCCGNFQSKKDKRNVVY